MILRSIHPCAELGRNSPASLGTFSWATREQPKGLSNARRPAARSMFILAPRDAGQRGRVHPSTVGFKNWLFDQLRHFSTKIISRQPTSRALSVTRQLAPPAGSIEKLCASVPVDSSGSRAQCFVGQQAIVQHTALRSLHRLSLCPIFPGRNPPRPTRPTEPMRCCQLRRPPRELCLASGAILGRQRPIEAPKRRGVRIVLPHHHKLVGQGDR